MKLISIVVFMAAMILSASEQTLEVNSSAASTPAEQINPREPIVPTFCSQRLSDGAEYCKRVAHVPDFDQRRTGRLSLDGNAHCVPTSTLNILTWLSNRGRVEGYENLDRRNYLDNKELYCSSEPAQLELAGGEVVDKPFADMCGNSDAWLFGDDAYLESGGLPAVLLDAAQYERVSEEIESLGFEMNTNGLDGPDDVCRTDDDHTGTISLSSAVRAIRSRADGVTVTLYGTAHCGEPVQLMTRLRNALDDGGIALMTIGAYTPNGSGYSERTAGHIVTVNGLLQSNGNYTVFFRDPARMGAIGDIDRAWPTVLCNDDDDCQDRQDPFFTETGIIEREVLDIMVGEETCRRSRWKINWADGTKSGHLDSFVTVVPN